MNSYPFTFLRVIPDLIRGEQLNVGVALFLEDSVKVIFDAPQWRMRALHPDLDVIDWSNLAVNLEATLHQLEDTSQRFQWLQNVSGSVRADSRLATLYADSEGGALLVAQQLVNQLVHYPSKSIQSPPRIKQSKTKLHNQLRNWFRLSKVFSANISDLSKHKIVPSYPVDPQDDLYADFALKNGALHLVEAIDLRGLDKLTKGIRGEAGLSAILFDQAKSVLTDQSKTIAVISADDYAIAKPIVGLMSKYASDVYELGTTSDKQRFADFIADSLHADTSGWKYPG